MQHCDEIVEIPNVCVTFWFATGNDEELMFGINLDTVFKLFGTPTFDEKIVKSYLKKQSL